MFACGFVRQIAAHPGNRASAALLAGGLLVGVCGCCLMGTGLAYEDDLVAGYAVWARDALESAAIVRKTSRSGAISVVGAMVFAYGWNSDFIIAKQHPVRLWPKVDTATTQWFLVEVQSGKVHGPLTEEKFLQVCQATGVPPDLTFTKYVGKR